MVSYHCLGCTEKSDEVYCDYCVGKEKTLTNLSRKECMFKAIELSGIPYQFRGVRLTQEQELLLVPAMNADTPGILLYGPPGVGKTHIAAWMAKVRLTRDMKTGLHSPRTDWWRDVMFIRADAALRNLRCKMMEGEEAAGISALGSVPFLVIDDLGSEKSSEWVGQVWHTILDQRLNAELETVITTNYKGSDLARTYGAWGDAIESRLRGLCTTVILKGKDRRRG